MGERTVSLFSFSKDYALSGFRVGYVASSQEIITQMAKIQMNDGAGPNVPAQIAAVAALRGPQQYLKEWWNDFDVLRKITVKRLNEISSVSCPDPEAGYFVFPDISSLGTSDEIWKHLIDGAKVAVSPGYWYGPHGEGRIRICYAAAPQETVETALDRIGKSLEKLQKT
jgi:aspartate/methionine/tyrosine aminotransferase